MKKIYFVFSCFLPILFSHGIEAKGGEAKMMMEQAPVDVTFVVDVTGLAVAEEGMFIAGDFSEFEDLPMTDNGDGTWVTTLSLEMGDSLIYNFKNGPDDWEIGETGDCFDEFGNRIIIVPAETTILPIVFFDSCDENPPTEMGAVDITFSVNTAGLTVAEEGMFINAFFTDFDDLPMIDNGDDIWSITASLIPGEFEFYNFKNGPDGFENGLFGDCFDEESDRVLEVPEVSTVLPLVYFNSCDNSAPPVFEMVDITFSVDASAIEVIEDDINLVGNFNGWLPEAMVDNGNGIWTNTVSLPVGATVYYNFYNGFLNKEIVDGDCVEPEFSSRQLVVPSMSSTLPVSIFSSCEDSDATITNTIDLLVEQQVKISPNPFHTETIISWDNSNNRTYEVMIFNLTGQLVSHYPNVNGINLSVKNQNLNAGIYLLKLRSDKGAIVTRKLVVE